jgi:hypothetical protein
MRDRKGEEVGGYYFGSNWIPIVTIWQRREASPTTISSHLHSLVSLPTLTSTFSMCATCHARLIAEHVCYLRNFHLCQLPKYTSTPPTICLSYTPTQNTPYHPFSAFITTSLGLSPIGICSANSCPLSVIFPHVFCNILMIFSSSCSFSNASN